MFEAVEELIGEHAGPREAARRPGGPRRPGERPQAQQALRRADPDRRHLPRLEADRRRHRDRARVRRDDPDFAAEVKELEKQREELTEELRLLLVPRDPSDDKDVILEVKAGEGGEESALFAGDLLRMYLRYAERVGWKTEIIDATESDLGGYKDVQVAVKTSGRRPSPARASGPG